MDLASSYNHEMEAPEEMLPAASALMYLAGFVVQICGFVAIGMTLDDPGLPWTLTAITFVGTFVSFLRRRSSEEAAPWELAVMVAVSVAFIAILFASNDSPFLLPDAAVQNPSKGIGVMLCWMVALRSFTLTSVGHLLFACVPTTAMIGLSGTQVTEPMLRNVFIAFVMCALFMLIHGGATVGGSADQLRRLAAGRALISSQAWLAVLYTVMAFVLATIISVPLASVGTDLVVPPSLSTSLQTVQPGRSSSPGTSTAPAQLRVAAGPVALSDQVVMRVRASQPAYWRNGTYDHYDGDGWSNTRQYRQTLSPISQSSDAYLYAMPGGVFRTPGPRTKLVQEVVAEGPAPFQEVYAASEPSVLEVGNAHVRVDGSGAFRLSPVDASRRYRVESLLPSAEPAQLRAANGAPPADIATVYTQPGEMREDVADRLRTKAAQVAGNAANLYDKVELLRAWIARECRYNTAAPAAPSGADVTENFLFTAKQGYCDSFATALAVMCRTLRIPARIATGYITGEEDPERHEYLVRDRHRHMWTEVYFPTIGWVTFDATQGSVDISPREQATTRRQHRSFLAMLFRRGWLPPVALLCLLGMIAYVLKVEIWDRLRPQRPAVAAEFSLPHTNREIIATYERACADLARRGVPRRPADTPSEHLDHATAGFADAPDVVDALGGLTRAVVRFRYSNAVATDTDVTSASEAGLALRAALRKVPRRRPAAADPVPSGA